MKIGIFGNTNNYPLLLAIGLRELGVDVVLIVNRKERLHRPESKYPEWQGNYPHWIVDCSDLAEEDWVAASPRLRDVINHLALRSDGLVLNDVGPSLLEFCALPAIALITGSDLSYFGNDRTVDLRWHGADPVFRDSPGARLEIRRWREFIARQRAGILSAKAVSAPLPGLVPAIDELLSGIGVPATRRDFFYLADVANTVAHATVPNQRLRVLNGARLNWKKPLPSSFSSQDHKGTDTLLGGFARFVASGGDADLVLFRKGLHVAETEALARSLGVDSRIIWRDEMSLRDFHAELSQADIVCDQLGESFPGLVALDAMAIGIPVIANFQPEIMGRYFPEPVAACQARTPSEVAGHLASLASSDRARATAGRAARDFAHAHLSPKANAVKCLRHLGLQ
jgi:glycosyltransferase involved in cell wall biosynthesis